MITLEDRAGIKLFEHKPEGWMLYQLLVADIKGAEISFHVFEQLRQQVITRPPQSNSEMMYHAKCYICAVRRVARLLESMVSHGVWFPEDVRREIKTQWKKKRTYLQAFTEPRDAIEHIDAHTTHSYCNLSNNVFTVVDGKSVVLDQDSLDRLRSVRSAIETAIDESISGHIDTVYAPSHMDNKWRQ